MGPKWESLDITCRLMALTIHPGIDYPCLISRPTSVLAGTFSRKCLIISGRSSPASSRYVEEQLAYQTSQAICPYRFVVGFIKDTRTAIRRSNLSPVSVRIPLQTFSVLIQLCGTDQ